MGRPARRIFKPDELKNYLKNEPQAEADVYYSARRQDIQLVANGRIRSFMNARGNIWTSGNKIGKSYVKIGELT